MVEKRESRRKSVSGHKRELILDAAKQVFAEEGLEGASLRAIATRAGYTPAALYFHFDCKEAIYAEVLRSVSGVPGRRRRPGGHQNHGLRSRS